MGKGAEEAISHAKPVLFIAGDFKSCQESAACYKCGGHCLCVGVPAVAHEPMFERVKNRSINDCM